MEDKYAKVLWDYLQLNDTLEKADVIWVFGNSDTRVAERGAELFLEGWASVIIFSGGLGKVTSKIWNKPEAEVFADIAIKKGVPKEKIVIENKSTHTGENIEFTKALLKGKNLKVNKVITVQKPYSEKRNFATISLKWPDIEAIYTSPKISYEDYPNEQIQKEDFINIMVGDFQRTVFPTQGYAVPQEYSKQVIEAYNMLIEMGYDKYLIKN
jgi:uncharacterized SAM-binding protein YcdF (DUF218 family)